MFRIPFVTLLSILMIMSTHSLADPPEPPAGKHWEPVPELTDDFDSFDSNKWQKGHPYWNGRPPSQYNNNNISYANGNLKLHMTVKDASMQGNWIWAACVTSRTKAFKQGMYSECEVKIADQCASTAYWMQGNYSEIDVIESFGTVKVESYRYLDYSMFTHTHYFINGWNNDQVTDNTTPNPGNARNADSYFTYGVWWKDSRNITFYRNGEVATSATTKGDFNENMYMFFDMEAMPWGPGLPTVSDLQDNSKNTSYFKYVKTWRLVDGTPIVNNIDHLDVLNVLSGRGKVEICDIRGRVIKTIPVDFSDTMTDAKQLLRTQSNGLPAGLYLYRYVVGNKTVVNKQGTVVLK